MTQPESLPRAVRRRARAEITAEIVEVARRHLSTVGAAGLSLRAVARELGMASSAVYRYVASRDDLLTLLIIDSFDALGAWAEDAERPVPRERTTDRWLAICHGVRDWALAHPYEYALIYGSPVPGYVAPPTTVGPATRVTALLSGVLADLPAAPASASDGAAPDVTATGGAGDGWRAALGPTREFMPAGLSDDVLIQGLMAWMLLFGSVSFELFGHLHQVIDDDPELRRAFFTEEATRIGALVGVPAGAA
ncbi:MAG: TetR/AcrR family transcriptional regulator [Actinobacteria bacterium]|nr:TetR/AcrR family transcriptional regulator [Actinomycetota bacterium]